MNGMDRMGTNGESDGDKDYGKKQYRHHGRLCGTPLTDGEHAAGQLVYSTQIPACLRFLRRAKNGPDAQHGRNARNGQVVFSDARKLGSLVDRTHRELIAEDIRKITNTYHAWRNTSINTPAITSIPSIEPYADIPGFCKSAPLDELRKQGYVLTPGWYVGAEEIADDGEPFDEKIMRLVAPLREQQADAARLDTAIAALSPTLFKTPNSGRYRGSGR